MVMKIDIHVKLVIKEQIIEEIMENNKRKSTRIEPPVLKVV